MQAGREGEMTPPPEGCREPSAVEPTLGHRLCPPTSRRTRLGLPASLCPGPNLLGKLRLREQGLPVPKASSQPEGLASVQEGCSPNPDFPPEQLVSRGEGRIQGWPSWLLRWVTLGTVFGAAWLWPWEGKTKHGCVVSLKAFY